MNQIKTVKIIGIFVSLAGLTVMLGWIFDIGPIKSVFSGLISMKFTTALCFFLSGVILYLMANEERGESMLTGPGIFLAALCIMVFMGAFLAGSILGMRTGIEDLFVRDKLGTPGTIFLGRPSVATMIEFILIAVAGVIFILNSRLKGMKIFIIGLVVSFVGAIAVLGYMIRVPILYYEVNGVSNAIAIHTASLFIIIGACLIILCFKVKSPPAPDRNIIGSENKPLYTLGVLVFAVFLIQLTVMIAMSAIIPKDLTLIARTTIRWLVLVLLLYPVIVIFFIVPFSKELSARKKASEALRASEIRYRRLFETAKDGVLILDAETGMVMDVNPYLLELLGFSREQLLEKRVWEVGFLKDVMANRENFLELQQKEYIHYEDLPLETVDGLELEVEFVSNLYQVNHHRVIQCNIRDITERKKAEASMKKYAIDLEALNDRMREKMNVLQETDQRLYDASIKLGAQKEFIQAENDRLEVILEQMGEGLLVINENRKVSLINNQAKKILGYGKGADIPEGFKNFFVLQLWREMHEGKGGIIRKELTLQRPREATLMVTLAPLHTGDADKGFVAVLRDITLEKQIEKMKSDFVANVSHEIRSPMAPMKDALSLVLDGTAGPITDSQKKFLSILNDNMERLGRLINDLLDLSKIEAGRMKLRKEKVDIYALARDTVESIKVFALRKEINLTVSPAEGSLDIECDKDRIVQVIINLVMNAVKFTPSGGGAVRVESAIRESGIVNSESGRSTIHEPRTTNHDPRK